MNSDLQVILEKDNPWLLDPGSLTGWFRKRLPDPYIPRPSIVRAHSRWTETDRAHLVVGPRQAGKSTAIWRYLFDLGEAVLFIDCEQYLVREWCRSSPLFLAELETLVDGPVILFFEEVQHLEEAGLFLKGLVDRKWRAPILATGSSSFHLHAKTRESLAGRATRTTLLPLSWSEVLWDLAGKPDALRARRAEERFRRHVTVGGYPAVWLSATPETTLTDLVEAIILRDASDLFRIERPDAFRRVLRLAATQAGNRINVSEWASIVGASRHTVAAYVEILESSHVVSLVTPFAGGRRAELTGAPKVFLVDNGIRNRLLHHFETLDIRADKGATLENWVFTELWKNLPDGGSVHFWRSSSGAEVDFVVARGDVLVAVEVKAERARRASIPRSARSFVEAYSPSELLMVNLGLEAETKLRETEVRFLHPTTLATRLQEIFKSG